MNSFSNLENTFGIRLPDIKNYVTTVIMTMWYCYWWCGFVRVTYKAVEQVQNRPTPVRKTKIWKSCISNSIELCETVEYLKNGIGTIGYFIAKKKEYLLRPSTILKHTYTP